MRLVVEAEARPPSSRAMRQRSYSASLTPSRSRYALNSSPSSLEASARMRAFCSTVHSRTTGFGLSATIGRLRASCSQRDRFCCRTPVSRASRDALTAFFPVSRWTIFCLKATENGFVMSSSSSRPEMFKFERRDNYPGTGGHCDGYGACEPRGVLAVG